MQKIINVIYASTSGNTELTVEYVGDILKSNGFEVKYHRAEVTPIEVFKANSLFLLATSTWEHGEINPFFHKLLKEFKTIDFHNKKAAFIGCGDMRYEEVLFCEGIEILKRAFIVQGGEQVHLTLKINGDPCNSLDTLVKNWTNEFLDEIKDESSTKINLFTKI